MKFLIFPREGEENPMLRKRSRPVHKEQNQVYLMPDSASDVVQKTRSSSIFSVPGVFVGFNAKGLSDHESVNSPTSPLDQKAFSKSPRSWLDCPPKKSWDCNRNKVGLGIIDSLNNEANPCGKGSGFFISRNILFGSQMGINIPSCRTRLLCSLDYSLSPRSLPKDYAISPLKALNIQRDSLDAELESSEIQAESEVSGKFRSSVSYSGRSSSLLTGLMYYNPKLNSDEVWSDGKNPQEGSVSPSFVDGGPNFDNFSDIKFSSLPISVGSRNGIIGSLSPSEIESSEDYTCVISHGPNPRKTHIYGDFILESHRIELSNCDMEELGIGSPRMVKGSDECHPLDDFLSFCFSCKKKLEEGKDIYMYRGEKAFCSGSCRSQEIFVEEEMVIPAMNSSHSPKPTCHDDILTGTTVAR